MSFNFDEEKITHVILFLIQCLGGRSDIQRVYLLMYLADVKHLVRYGTLITGDTYIAMKSGPVPFYMLGLYRRLKEQPISKTISTKVRRVLSLENETEAVAHIHCDTSFLSESEVECIFETVHAHKHIPIKDLFDMVRNRAWIDSDISGEIKLAVMASVYGASDDMIRYINTSYGDELESFKHYENVTD